MKRSALVYILVFSIRTIVAQTDSTHYGRIIIRGKDTTAISIATSFTVSYDDPQKIISYRDYVLFETLKNKKALAAGRVLITYATPQEQAGEGFDYARYFRMHPVTGKIVLREGETDTVRLFIMVDPKGNVKFTDLSTAILIGKDTAYLDAEEREYKTDLTHSKTQAAFRELASQRWIPARISMMKTHPSTHRNKYRTEPAYMSGMLTVIYSRK